MGNLELKPLTFSDACDFVEEHHSHHDAPQGHKFSIGVQKGGDLVGVVIVGRPVSRHSHMVRCITKDGKTETGGRDFDAGWYRYHPDSLEKVGSFAPDDDAVERVPEECNGSLFICGHRILFDPLCRTDDLLEGQGGEVLYQDNGESFIAYGAEATGIVLE